MNEHLNYEDLKDRLEEHEDTQMSLSEFCDVFPEVAYYKIGDIAKSGQKVTEHIGGISILNNYIYQFVMVGNPEEGRISILKEPLVNFRTPEERAEYKAQLRERKIANLKEQIAACQSPNKGWLSADGIEPVPTEEQQAQHLADLKRHLKELEEEQ